MYSNALGQEGEDVVNFKVISNTTDFKDNNPNFFRVNPYDGIEFDRRFPWYISALSASVPFDRNPLVESSIWYKRLQIPSSNTYKQLYDSCFTARNYDNTISECPRISFPQDKGKDLFTGKTAPSLIPDEFINFFNCKYVNRTQFMGHLTAMVDIYPLLTIAKASNINDEANDLFELEINRSQSDDADYRILPTTPLNERGYVEIIRMSRTLAILLGLNVVEDLSDDNPMSRRSFPKFNSNIPVLNVKEFSKEMFEKPPIDQLKTILNDQSLEESGFWGNLLLHYQIPMVLIKINQSYEDDDNFQGGNLDESTFTDTTYLDYHFKNQEQLRKEQYSDYFIVTILKSKDSLRAQYYDDTKKWNNINILPRSSNPNMLQFTRGISWSVSKYIRYPLGVTFTITGDFIEDNIYSGRREKTLLSEEIPLGIKHQYAYSKYHVPVKVPLSNEMKLYNFITLSFATKRQLRSHLHLTQKKLSKFKHRVLKKKEVRLKSYRYPILLTLRAAAMINQ